ncbi:myosin phosphatase Rho-interacting protein-like isoform X2 [Parambassis ranga]|uniref:Myosin phosphatase Rho-interacting protein-like isoform X2 n=1 Tax=Parambassis ranga TaxID=210632 RepID=A0A6P7IUE9_9TELE|nr:myosin phosphatase Rho-interacting protein-like isoform X2 [Parambassis ranga]
MSGEKATSPCSKFQANIFNKSKCQNCFKSRELHLLNDCDMDKAKPIYGGWLCLAPVGTDFNNPMQRSRKWQRRFFILYEHGSLSFALDELPSTLPQGTVNMNLCTDIADAEPRTGQRNALCIITPEQEIFIRGDNKEIINGWSEQLMIYLRTNKQNPKKKRKVEPVANQEPSPPKMAATDSTFPSSVRDPAESSRWQEEAEADVTPVWTVTDTDPASSERTPAGNASSYLCPVSTNCVTLDGPGSFGSPSSSLDLAADVNPNTGSNSQHANNKNNKNQRQDRSSKERFFGLEDSKKEQVGETAGSRKGRSEARTKKREKLQSCGDIAQLSAAPPQRRSKSLDRRTSDMVMTPDLLNFKKGWMVKLDEDHQWKKYWFVLSTDSLRYYKDSIAEEASDLKGEIDLTKCYNVSEYQVQRNYGFQIHTPKGVFTLSAMTAGIRKNWIHALMKNVHPANAPDVASLPGQHLSCSLPEVLPKPDVTQDSLSTDTPAERDPNPKPRGVMERRREGRYRTFDWAEFRPQTKPTADADPPRTKSPCDLELGDLERRKRREERRKRYERMLGFSLGLEETGDTTADSSVRALSPKSQQRMEEEVEECWKQVEKNVFRLEKTVPLFTAARDAVEMPKLLDSYRKRVEDLKVQLAESEHCRLKLEAQLSSAGIYQQQLEPPVCSEQKLYQETHEEPLNSQTQDLNEARELLQQQNILRQDMQEHLDHEPPSAAPQLPSIWLHDTEGHLQELEDLLPEIAATPLLSPASDSQPELSQSDGDNIRLDGTTHPQNQLDRKQCPLFPTSETQVTNCDFISLIMEKPAEADDTSPNHVAPDLMVLRRLSQEVELLTGQNEALNQRNQEMVNQLTEADREIERLKAELSSRYTEPHHLPEVEQQGKTRLEDLERELSLKNQELLEAQILITTLKDKLRETEALLPLSDLSETDKVEESETKKSAEKTEGYLLRCFEATEARLTELERQLKKSELSYTELQQQNTELKEKERLYCQRAAETEADIRQLREELEKERLKESDRNSYISAEEKIQKVIEGLMLRLRALGKLLEVINRLDFVKESEQEEKSPAMISQLKWEEKFWGFLLNKLKEDVSQQNDPLEEVFVGVTEHMMLERQLLLVGHGLLLETEGMCESKAFKDLDTFYNTSDITASETTNGNGVFDFNKQLCDTQMKIFLLNQVTSSAELQITADRLYNVQFSGDPWSISFIHSAATEALYSYYLSRHMSECKRGLCYNCADLMEENRTLKASLATFTEELTSSLYDKVNTCCQTDETYPQEIDDELQSTDGNNAEESMEENEIENEMTEKDLSLNGMEIPVVEIQKISEEHFEESDETDPSAETELISALREKVKELEEQLSALANEMKEEFEGKMISVQMQHQQEMEKLKATCEHGFTCMEESHLKVVEELQRRHQHEVERLLVERDKLLEEESAATATAIEAIKNAHCLELQREIHRRCQSENGNGDTDLEDIQRGHSEEVASYQRELDVLSQQFSLKCLENGHLVQALDAERKALCQCQQENQELRTKNQELSGHLAAEITRLCSLARQDALPLSQGMDVYELEITLRVKESEVQCLKQEIISLKDELHSAQQDKRNATKKYKDMYTELSIVRAKAEREAKELRENLRLAHQALGHSSL